MVAAHKAALLAALSSPYLHPKFAVAVEDALEDEPRQRMATAAPATHHLRVLEDSMLGRSARGPRR